MFKALFGYRAVLDELDACQAARAEALAESERNRVRLDSVLAELSSVREYYRQLTAARVEHYQSMTLVVARAEKAEADLSVAVVEQGRIRCGFLAELRAQCELTEGAAADVGSALIRADAAEAELAASHIREKLLAKRILTIRDALYIAVEL